MPSYTDLSTYRKCPRLYGFKLLGYQPIETPEPIQTGQFVHAAIAAHFKSQDAETAIRLESYKKTVPEGMLDLAEARKLQQGIETSVKRAIELTSRYIEHWAKDYTATLVEPELRLGGVVCHPDLIAYYSEQRVIVDFKTSKSPDMRWYDVSGQVDLYAYVIEETEKATLPQNAYPIQLVIYDIISEEGIFRHIRPPRLEAGERLLKAIQWLDVSDRTVKAVSNYVKYLDDVHFTYDCPQRCSHWIPCWLLETADWSACEDYLKGNFIKEES